VREKQVQKLLKFSAITFLLVFCLFPVLWMVIVSFAGHPDFLSNRTDFLLTFDNYADIISSSSLHLWDYLRNSILISLISAVCATLFAALSAYAITRLRFPGRILIPLVLLAFSMFPQISIVGYLFKLMTWLKWINTYAALVFPYMTIGMPLALWIMMSYFSRLPIDLEKAALVDGATRFQILRKIIFPMAAPGIFSTLMLIFIFSFNEFLFALMLTIDYKARTVPVGIALFEGLHGRIPWGQIMASAVIATAPVLLLVALFQKYIIQGLSEGAVKG
jgi:multiple sugar transport system permease protein